MPQTPPTSPLLQAATQLEDELRRYEGLTEEIERSTVHSQKSMARVTRIMQQATECHEQMMQQVAVLSQAMNDTRVRQQTCAEKLVAAAGRVQERMTIYQELLARHGALGEASRALNEHAAGVAARKADGAPLTEVLESTADVLKRMDETIETASTLTEDARTADFNDVTRDVDSLKQQLQSARNQLLLARKTLTERAPS